MSDTPTCELKIKGSDVPGVDLVNQIGRTSAGDADPKWNLAYRLDSQLTENEDQRLRRLLISCFTYNPFFWFRRFHLERPEHRWLARSAAGQFIGHAALHQKIIGTANGEIRIGGVSEVCVAENYRGHGILKVMLSAVHEWMIAREMPFSMLFGQPRIYASSGYAAIGNELRASNSIVRLWIPGRSKPLVKSLAGLAWPKGIIDLRGPTF